MPISELYTKEQVYDTITSAREIFSDIHTTLDKWELMEKGLTLAYIHCPEDISHSVLATLEESFRRKEYMIERGLFNV